MAESQRGSTSRGGGYSTRSSADNTRDMIKQMEKPKLNLNKKVDREEEEKKLKQILRDDFLDDDGDDADLEYAPVKLPFTPGIYCILFCFDYSRFYSRKVNN